MHTNEELDGDRFAHDTHSVMVLLGSGYLAEGGGNGVFLLSLTPKGDRYVYGPGPARMADLAVPELLDAGQELADALERAAPPELCTWPIHFHLSDDPPYRVQDPATPLATLVVAHGNPRLLCPECANRFVSDMVHVPVMLVARWDGQRWVEVGETTETPGG